MNRRGPIRRPGARPPQKRGNLKPRGSGAKRGGGSGGGGGFIRRGIGMAAGYAADRWLPDWASRGARAIGALGARTEQPMSKSFMPAATNTMTRSYYKTATAPLHQEYGAGLRVIACQFLTSTDATSGKADGFASGVSSIAISPDSIGGPMATDARNYSYYAFRSLKFHFISNMPSTDTFRQAFSYFPDSAIATFATVNFSTMQSTQDSVVTSRRQNCTLVAQPYSGSKVWFTEIDATSSASLRQTEQGILYSFLSANETQTQTTGEVLIEYVLDLYGRSPDYAFTLSFREASEAKKALRVLDDAKVEICKRDRARLLRCLALRGSNAVNAPATVSICDGVYGNLRAQVGEDGHLSMSTGGVELDVNVRSVGGSVISTLGGTVGVPVNIHGIGGAASLTNSAMPVIVVSPDGKNFAGVTAGGHVEVKTNVSLENKARDSSVKFGGELNPQVGTGSLRQIRIDGSDSKYRERVDNVNEEYVQVQPSTPIRPLCAMKRQETK